jgi:serine kinase of HPr protein (carbohydrate metabolism regulator)
VTSGQSLHASAVLVGEAGVLVRGESGAGKSTLVRRIIESAQAKGLFARLIADDRVILAAEHGRLVARPHPAIAGRMEVRGVGIVAMDHAAAAVIRLVVDCGAPPLDRLPLRDQLYSNLGGVSVRRMVAGPDDAERVLFVLEHPDDPSSAMEPE